MKTNKDDQEELKQVATKIIIEHLKDQKHNGAKVDFALRSCPQWPGSRRPTEPATLRNTP